MDLQWHALHANSSNKTKPNARWGHSGCSLSDPYIFLFGGYSQSKYYNDTWIYDWSTMTWAEIETVNAPQPRSNSTVVYDNQRKVVILFGGGSAANVRHNDIWLLDLTKQKSQMGWQLISKPGSDSQSLSSAYPWPRTYHTGCLYKNHLFIHGGEGYGNDLEDIWAFDLKSMKWAQVFCQKSPCGRRFHSGALVGSYFYVIGGCYDGYNCLNDVHRINLNDFFQQKEQINQSIESKITIDWNQIQLTDKNLFLPRWGHMSCSIEDNIYIFGGRSTNDHNDLLLIQTKEYYNYECFEKISMKNPQPQTNSKMNKDGDTLKKSMKISKLKSHSSPKGRRRACLWNIGSCLVVHGGFNGNYFDDLIFINLHKTVRLNHQPLTFNKIDEPQKTGNNGLKQIKSNKNILQSPRLCLQQQRKKAKESELFWKSFDIHIYTKDKKIIHMRSSDTQNAFTSYDKMIQFIQLLAEMPYAIAKKFTNVLQQGVIPDSFSDMDRQLLYINGVIHGQCVLSAMQKRMMTNIIHQEVFMTTRSPLRALKVSEQQIDRIYQNIQVNPTNNLMLQLQIQYRKVYISVNKYQLAKRSQYFASIIKNVFNYSDNKFQLFTISSKKPLVTASEIDNQLIRTLSNYKLLIIYLHHGHMVLPQTFSFDNLLECYTLAQFYLIQGARRILLEQILIRINWQSNIDSHHYIQQIKQSYILQQISPNRKNSKHNSIISPSKQGSLKFLRSNNKINDNLLEQVVKFCLEGADKKNLNKILELVIGRIIISLSKKQENSKYRKHDNNLFSFSTISKMFPQSWNSGQKQTDRKKTSLALLKQNNDKENKENKQNKQNVPNQKMLKPYQQFKNKKKVQEFAHEFHYDFQKQVSEVLKALEMLSGAQANELQHSVKHIKNSYKLQLSYWLQKSQ